MHIECLHLSHGASRVMPRTGQVSSKQVPSSVNRSLTPWCTFLQAGMQQLVKNLSDIRGMKQASGTVGVRNCSNFCSVCGGCLGKSPRVLRRWPCRLKLDEEKSKRVGLAHKNGFAHEYLQTVLKLIKGAAKCAPSAREKCNNYVLTAAPCFRVANHNDE